MLKHSSHTLSPHVLSHQYVKTHVHKRSALDTRRHTHTYTLSHWYMQTHADKCKHTLTHSALGIGQTHAHPWQWRCTLSSRNMPTNTQLSRNMQTYAQLLNYETEWRYMPYSQIMQADAQPIETHAFSHLGLDTDTGMQRHNCPSIQAKQMQMHSLLLIRAATCRNMSSLGYMHKHAGPSICACTCIVAIHSDADNHTFLKPAEKYATETNE